MPRADDTGTPGKEDTHETPTLSFDTRAIRAGEDPYPNTAFSLRPPIHATKSYAYPSLDALFQHHYYYSRTENPTTEALDQKLANLHGGEAAVSVASGMGAIHLACSSAIQVRKERLNARKLAQLYPTGDPAERPNIVTHTSQYTGTYRLFTKIYPQMGIETKLVDLRDVGAARRAVNENTKVVFVESPANPTVDILDVRALADLAHEVGAQCIVDNTWASPALQRPLELGADLVVESLTKYVNGHGDALGGAIVGAQNHLRDVRYFWLETQGQVLSPFNAWLILRGTRTLGLRMERHGTNAMKVA